MTDYCATCGQPLELIHGTATVAHVGRESQKGCINERGWYWSESRPLERENLFPSRAIRGIVIKNRYFYLYQPLRY